MKKLSLVILFMSLLGSTVFAMSIIENVDININNVEEEIERELEVKSGVLLYIWSTNGSIKVTTWNQDYVYLHMKKIASSKEDLNKIIIDIRNNKEKLQIKTKKEDKKANIGVSYTLKIPEHIIVKLLDTSNGSIYLEGTKGNAELDTSNSGITVKNVAGFITADTSNGSIEVYNSGIYKLDTSNSSITAEIGEVMNDILIDTSNGSIELYLSEKNDVELKLDTSNGKISFEDFKNVSVFEEDDDYFHGQIGTGKYKLLADTSNGSIRIYQGGSSSW